MAAARRRRLSAATASLLLALLVLLPVAALPSAADPAPTAGDASDADLTITSITTVVEGDESATVRGTLTNPGTSTLTRPKVSLVPKDAGPHRSDIAEWTRDSTPIDGTAVDSTTLEDVPAGGSTPFVLTVDATELIPDQSAGAAWVSIQAAGTAVHTFIGVHRRKEYVPLRLLWGIPLLLPADRRLFDHRGAERDKAWQGAVGDDSRLAALTATPPAKDEAWLLDPTLVDAPQDAPDSGISTAERTVRSERASALRDQLVGPQTLVLPDADADVAAGAGSATARRLVRGRVKEGVSVAQQLGARSDVLWPADGLATQQRATALDALRPGGGSTLLVPDSSLAPGSFTPTGATRTTGGTPLVVRDGPLSSLVEGLASADDVLLARQQLVAETASVLSERAGTSRTLVIVPDRSATPDPEAWERLRDSTGAIPWLAEGDLTTLLDDDVAAAAPERTPRTRSQIQAATKGDAPAPAVLTSQRAADLIHDTEAMFTFASVRADGPTWRREMTLAIRQLTSTRWRSDLPAYSILDKQLTTEVTLADDDLQVSSGDVNFFADTGRLQITIVNRTDVQLSHLVVRLVPDSPSLRIDGDPDPVTIGPDGRHTVTVNATALAAGQVPVQVSVATPDGEEIAVPATLHVKVRPTGAWIYRAIGGAALLLLAAGTWRTVRGGRRAPEATSATDDPEDHEA